MNVSLEATSVEVQEATSGKLVLGKEADVARLIRITWTFETTDDNKDHDTVVGTSCDNGAVLLGAGDVGGNQEWPDRSTRVVGIPVANAASWESCAVGNIHIVERPNGDDEWHFNVTLFLEFERGGWWRIRWTGINLAEDRPHFHGSWRSG